MLRHCHHRDGQDCFMELPSHTWTLHTEISHFRLMHSITSTSDILTMIAPPIGARSYRGGFAS